MLSKFLLIALLGTLIPTSSEAEPALISVSPRTPVLRTVDAADGSTLDASIELTLTGETVLGATGLATDPQTGTVYALLKVQFQQNSRLVSLNTRTGVATSIGDTGEKFAALTFASDGTLYAMTGDGAATPQSLYTLSKTDASNTFLASRGVPEQNVTDGEALSFNPGDGLLYRASGIGPPNTAEVFETIDPGTLGVLNIPLSGFDYEELTALLYLGGEFYAGDVGDSIVDMPQFMRITTGGAVSFLGNMDHVTKGLILAPPPVPTLQPLSIGVVVLTLMLVGCAGAALTARR